MAGIEHCFDQGIQAARLACLDLQAARDYFAEHPTYEMAVSVQTNERILREAVNYNRARFLLIQENDDGLPQPEPD